jgi:drug/metabolite transporter (DMT)-like permease
MTPFANAGELAALATAACWTICALFFETAGRRVGSLAVNLIRLVLAMGLLSLYCWFVRGSTLPGDASIHAWIWLGLSGLIGFNLGDLCLFRAFVVIGSRLSMLIMALVPPFAAVIGWAVLGEHLTAQDMLGMTLTVAGVAIVILQRKNADQSGPSGIPVTGLLLGLGGAFGQAAGLVLSKLGMGEYDAFAATQIRVIAGIVGFIVIFSCIGWWPRVRAALGNRRAMAQTSVGAVFGPFLGVSLSLLAVKYTEAGVAATIMALVPVLIIPPAVLILKEKVSRQAVLGSVIAVAGSALLFL